MRHSRLNKVFILELPKDVQVGICCCSWPQGPGLNRNKWQVWQAIVKLQGHGDEVELLPLSPAEVQWDK
jgi:hypothetical protein